MISFVINKLKTKKFLFQGIIFFVFFISIYLVLDYLNFRESLNKPSTTWVVVNIFVNIFIAFMSALLMNLSTLMLELKFNGEGASNLGFFSVVFGIFTYGCTSCVVTFLAAIGISFSPTIFPLIGVWYGFIYKILSLLLIILGLFLVTRNITKGTCKVKFKNI